MSLNLAIKLKEISNMTDLNHLLINKSVKIFLRNDFGYNGKLLSNDGNQVTLLDKFGQILIFNFAEIRVIQGISPKESVGGSS